MPEHEKQAQRKQTRFSVYSAAIMPSGKKEVLMKHIRQPEAVEALVVGVRVCRCGSGCVLKTRSLLLTPVKSDYLEGTYSLTPAWPNNGIHCSSLWRLQQTEEKTDSTDFFV